MRRGSLKKIISAVLLTGASMTLLSSCATKKFVQTLHEESMAKDGEIEARLMALDRLERSIAVLDSITREQNRLIMGTRAYVGTQTQSQYDNILSLSARLENITQMLNELNGKVEAIQLYGGVDTPGSSAGGGADTSGTSAKPVYSPVPAQSVDPRELYTAALADYNGQSYTLAESRFMAFLIQFPAHELAGNAQYWLGEIDYACKKYDLAVTEFQKLIDTYPASEKIPAAMLKMGYAQIELGQKNTGIAILKKLTKDFPTSDEAKLASTKLKKLGK